MYDGIPYQVKQRAGDQSITSENMEKSQHTNFNEDMIMRLMKVLVWPVETYGCESWTLRKNEETRLDGFEMKGLRKILWVSRTAKKTNEWVLNKAGVKRELLDTVKARKLAYYGHTMRKQWSCLEKQIMQGTMPGAHRREDHTRPGWTTSRRRQDTLRKSQSECQRTEINGESTSMMWPTLGSRTAKEQNQKRQIAFAHHCYHHACTVILP